MSTVGSNTSNGPRAEPAGEAVELPPVHVPFWVRYIDFAVLALALPVFIVAGFPITGYLVAAGAWTVQRIVQVRVQRRAAASTDPRTIVGLLAGSMIARGWFCAIAIFLCGILDSDNAGLAAALLVVLLFTVYFVVQMIVRPMERPLRTWVAR